MEGMPLADVRNRAWFTRLCFLFMRLLPWVGVRNRISRLLASALGMRHGRQKRFSPAAADAVVLGELGRSGLALMPEVLTGRQIDEMLAFLKDKELVATNGLRFSMKDVPAGIKSGSYPLATVLHCPHVLALINSPQLLRIASGFLGCTPTISGLRIDWSGPSDGDPSYVQQFHRDHDDWRFLKLLVYLTDVDEGSGPHEYVTTSHLDSGRLTRRPYEQDEVERQYGRERICKVHGSKGTSFLVNTWGIHKGNVPENRPRLMLQVQYSLLPVWRYAYQPVRMALPRDYCAHINRLIVASNADHREHAARGDNEAGLEAGTAMEESRDMDGIIAR